MKAAWLTDIHLNFLEQEERFIFYNKVVRLDIDVVFITGDIAEAPSVTNVLIEMANVVKKNIYFVLGNHDYYRSTINSVRSKMLPKLKKVKWLHWLPFNGPIILNSDVILVGQDGWADGRYGNYQGSPVVLLDSRLIEELFNARALGKSHLLQKMQELADHDITKLENDLTIALKNQPKKIIVLSHVPPFKETCLYEGKISDDDFLPFFGSKVLGDLLIKLANANPQVDFLVLCGHTHHECHYRPFTNLTISVGKAEYYYPEIQKVIDIGT